jgi:hypothetical protein
MTTNIVLSLSIMSRAIHIDDLEKTPIFSLLLMKLVIL